MRTNSVILVVVAVLAAACTAVSAEPAPAEERAYIGVRLDQRSLPELLRKHLRLSPKQGVRIQNIHRNSPADKAGLERDDIIIGFEGEQVTGYEQIVEAVRDAEVGTEVSLEVVHLGQRRTVRLELGRLKDEQFDWKYAVEPELVTSWRPGRMFQLKPGGQRWDEIPFHDILTMPDVSTYVREFTKELRTYHYTDGERSYTITIEGDPNEEDSTITVRIGDTEHKTTIKEIDELPEKYRSAARQALEKARESAEPDRHFQGLDMSLVQPWSSWKQYFENLKPYQMPEIPRFGPGDETFDVIEEQMRELRERIEQLEKSHREMLDGLVEKLKRQESAERGKESRQDMDEGQRI